MPPTVQLGGPFTKLGPLRNVEGVAEISGHLSAAGLVLILTACLTIYGAVAFQQEKSQIGIKTLSGAPPPPPPPHTHTHSQPACPPSEEHQSQVVATPSHGDWGGGGGSILLFCRNCLAVVAAGQEPLV